MLSSGDVLGDKGRKALDACVKVKILGTPDQNIAKYHWRQAWDRLNECYAGGFPDPSFGYPGWLKIEEVVNLMLPTEWNEDWSPKDKICDIKEIHGALENFDKQLYVEKYPKSGPRSDELRKLIDKRRADIERECEEATADPNAMQRYSWLVAQRRVRDCYAGSFAGDRQFLEDKHQYELPFIIEIQKGTDPNTQQTASCFDSQRGELDCYARSFADDRAFLEDKYPNKLYSIIEIHDAVVQHEKCCDKVQKYPENEGPGSEELKKSIEKHNSEMKKEYQEAKRGLQRYSQGEAEKRVRDCFYGYLHAVSIKEDESGEPNTNKTYDIIDIYNNALHHREKAMKMEKSGCLGNMYSLGMFAVKKEYEKAKSKLGKYSRHEAERRARDCFVGTLRGDTEIFPTTEEKVKSGIPKIDQTYDIFDIKNAIDHFDAKGLRDKYLDEKDDDSKKKNQQAKEQRKKIADEYAEATSNVEIEHGSGFIVHDHFIITNKHVIEDAENDKTKKICVSNAAIHGELVCMVAYADKVKDLALLYCQQLNIEQNGITPLYLSNQSLLPGMQIFSFGYPISHRGKKAIFVNGFVSGSKETNNKLCSLNHMMVVLNCSLNSGNSGGPILCWEKGDLKVLGVATQKHFKEILTLDEIKKIEKIRESLQTFTIAGVSDVDIKCSALGIRPDKCQTSMNLLTLKLYDALETHSQFNLSNALPGHCVVEFIQETFSKYKGQCKEELLEILKWSRDHANVLPSGHHFASNCCIQ